MHTFMTIITSQTISDSVRHCHKHSACFICAICDRSDVMCNWILACATLLRAMVLKMVIMVGNRDIF